MTFILAIAGTIAWAFLPLMSEHTVWLGIILRALAGVVIGGFSSVIPMYIVELAPPEATGFFGSLNQLGVTIGVTLCYVSGIFCGWQMIAVVGSAIALTLALIIWYIPESPVSGKTAIVDDPASSWEIFRGKWLCKTIVCMLLMVFQQFCGVNAILTNLSDLFSDAGVTLDINVASTITSIAQVISVLIGGFLIEKIGRRWTWIVSFGGLTIADLLYALCRHERLQKRFPRWFPIADVFLFLLAYGLGGGPIPWFVASEMFPPELRPAAASAVSVSNWSMVFVVVEAFPYVKKAMGDFGCFLVFTVFSLIGTIFGVFYITDPKDHIGESTELITDAREF